MKSLLPFIVILHWSASRRINDKPIIGVLVQKLQPKIPGVKGTSYLSAAYVKYLESAGARVVPIRNDITKDQLNVLFSYINGALLPGGDADLMHSAYRTNTEYIMKLARRAFDKGDHFPVWGTCLGLQAMVIATMKSDGGITSSSGTWDRSMRLQFTEEVPTSKMFSHAPPHIMKILRLDKVTYNAHYNCVSIHSYKKSHALHKTFKVLSVNKDSKGKTFVSTMEGRSYPFYAVQWHPEMNAFEFNYNEGLGPNINHSYEAILASQFVGNFFVKEARKSRHRFPNKSTENKHLIYNYAPIYSAMHDQFDTQMYVF